MKKIVNSLWIIQFSLHLFPFLMLPSVRFVYQAWNKGNKLNIIEVGQGKTLPLHKKKKKAHTVGVPCKAEGEAYEDASIELEGDEVPVDLSGMAD